MKDRLITLAGALVALYIFVVIFINPQVSDFVEVSTPTSVDRGNNGLKGLYQWLQQSGVGVYQLRRRYDDLGEIQGLPKRGNLMIITLPQISPARKQEIGKLQKWVRQGNHVLMLVAKSDSFLQQGKSGYGSNEFLGRFGFQLIQYNEKTDTDSSEKSKKDKKVGFTELQEDADKELVVKLTPRGRHAVTNKIASVHGKTPKLFSDSHSLVSTSSQRSSLALLTDKAAKSTAFWETRYGRSRVWVSRFAYLFSNDQLGDGDNARLIANIVSTALSAKGKVIFDDMHQGSAELYDEEAFFSDSRLHNTIWFVFAFWILYVIGHTNRIAPLSKPVKYSKVSEFVHAMANLFARRLNKVAAATLLFSHFFDWIRLRYSLPTNGKPVWELLENTERIDQSDLKLLKQSYANLQNNKKVNLMKLVNRMQKIRSALV